MENHTQVTSITDHKYDDIVNDVNANDVVDDDVNDVIYDLDDLDDDDDDHRRMVQTTD